MKVDWYQTEHCVIVTLLVKNVENVEVVYGKTKVRLTFAKKFIYSCQTQETKKFFF